MYKFEGGGGGGGGGEADATPLPCIFVGNGCITMKFCTGVDNHSVTSNIKKEFQKFNVIMLKSLSFCRKIQKTHEKYMYHILLMAISQ